MSIWCDDTVHPLLECLSIHPSTRLHSVQVGLSKDVLVAVAMNPAISNTLPNHRWWKLEPWCCAPQHDSTPTGMPTNLKRHCLLSHLAQSSTTSWVKIYVSFIKVPNLGPHVGRCNNLPVDVPDPAINCHHMVTMILGLVGDYTKGVVALLQEAKHSRTKRNKSNAQQLRTLANQLNVTYLDP